MLVLIVLLFLLCWGPRLIMNVLIKLGLTSFTHSAYTARIACYLLSFIHSALNPFVYGLMSSNFRKMVCHSCPPGVIRTRSGRAGTLRRNDLGYDDVGASYQQVEGLDGETHSVSDHTGSTTGFSRTQTTRITANSFV